MERTYSAPKLTEFGTVADLTRKPPSSPPGQGGSYPPGKPGSNFDGFNRKK